MSGVVDTTPASEPAHVSKDGRHLSPVLYEDVDVCFRRLPDGFEGFFLRVTPGRAAA